MAEPLYKLLDNCTVRLDLSDKLLGTGFFIAPGLILTCAHVIEHTVKNITTVKAHHSGEVYPIHYLEKYLPKPYPDLALLRIDFTEHRCIFWDTSVSPTDRMYSFGYTKNHPAGESTTLTSEGTVWIDDSHHLWKLKAGQVLKGSSGSPLLNLRTGAVCGVIKSSRDKTTDLGGAAIPVDVVLSEMPILVVLQKQFHNANPYWIEMRDIFVESKEPTPSPTIPDAIYYKEAGIVRKPETLIGRDNLVTLIKRLLDESKQVLLSGFGGNGKSALAAVIADDSTPAIWLEVGNRDTNLVFEALAKLFKDFGEEEYGEDIISLTGDAQIKVLRDLLIQSEANLLVLDNAQDGKALNNLLRAVPENLAVLVTSRRHYPLDEIIDVGDLLPEDGLDLLKYHAGKKSFKDDEDARELCALLGNHAYALEIAGNTLKVDRRTPGELLERIADAPHETPMPEGFAEEGRGSVKDLLDDSFNALDEKAQGVFQAFGAMFAPGTTSDLLSVFMDQEKETLEISLDNLVRRSLAVRREGTNYYSIHNLTFSYTRVVGKNNAGNQKTMIAAIQRYVENHAEDYDLLALDLANILGGAEAADSEVRLIIMERLTLGGYFDARGHTLGLLELLDKVLNQLTTQKDQNELDEDQLKLMRNLLGKRGNAYFDRGDHQKATEAYQIALDLSEENHIIVILSGLIGKTLSFGGQEEEARAYFDQGYELSRKLDDISLRSIVLGQESHAAGYNEDYERVLKIANEQVSINERLLNENNQPDILKVLFFSWINLGSAELDLATKMKNPPGEISKGLKRALLAHNNALKIAEQTNDDLLRAHAFSALMEDYHFQGNPAKVYEYSTKARRIWQSKEFKGKAKYVSNFMEEHNYTEIRGDEENNQE